MRKFCAKMVPKNLTTEQKANRRHVCLNLLDRLEREPEFFSRVITGDESWILEYDPQDKTPKSWVAHCKLSLSKESDNEQIQNQIDAHLFFWQSRDRPQGICATRTNSIKLFIGKFLKDSGKGWHGVRPGIARTWMLHHDNAPCHTAVPINEFLAEKSIPVVPQPPYLTGFSPCDFFLFSRLKNHM